MLKPVSLMTKSERFEIAVYYLFSEGYSFILAEDTDALKDLKDVLSAYLSDNELKELGFYDLKGNEDAALSERFAMTEDGMRYEQVVRATVKAFDKVMYYDLASELDVVDACCEAVDRAGDILTDDDKEWLGWYNDDPEYWERKENKEVGV